MPEVAGGTAATCGGPISDGEDQVRLDDTETESMCFSLNSDWKDLETESLCLSLNSDWKDGLRAKQSIRILIGIILRHACSCAN